jgi:hypothetical protein
MAGAKPKDKPKPKKKKSQPASGYLKRKETTKKQLDQAFNHLKKKPKKGK